LSFHGVVCNAYRCGVIAVYGCGGLWVSLLNLGTSLEFDVKVIYHLQAERGFATGAVLFDLWGNGAFWKIRV
jgi:hypothetical protein